tara:strand:+ start:996 stop:1304 length:309 start_codon:yes stop_codon:yes gene_type:complete
MEENQNNSWDEISDDMAEVKRKIKDKVTIENSIDDLKNSFQSIIENSKDILINLMNAVDETVKDKEIRSESKEIIMKMSFELTDLIENGKNKISNLVKEEEE